MGAMKGDIRVHIHCYRADEMAIMLDLAKEFGFKVAAFHHGVEAYKLADRLAAEGVCGALWADWWGFKMEALDGIEENIALVDRPAGGCAIVHSDSSEGIQRLNQEAGEGDGACAPRRHRHHARARDPLAHREPGARARHRRADRHAASPARWPTWCCGTARPSASTRTPRRCSSTARCCTTATTGNAQPRSDFMLGQGGVAMKRAASLALPAAVAGAAQAQDVLIRNATVHTAGARGTLKNADVLVQGGIIRAVGRRPADAAGRDRGRGQRQAADAGPVRRLLRHRPGRSVGGEEHGGQRAGRCPARGAPQMRPEFDVTLAYNPDSMLLPVARLGGITFTALSANSGERQPGRRPGRRGAPGRRSVGGDDRRAPAVREPRRGRRRH